MFRDARNVKHLLKKNSAIGGASNRHEEAGKASQVHWSPGDMIGVSDFEHACIVLGNTLLDSILLSTGNLFFPFYASLLHFSIGVFTFCHCVFKVCSFLLYKGSQIKDYLGSRKEVWILEQY